MEALFRNTLVFMEKMLNHLHRKIPRPIKKPYRDSFVYRYEEEGIYQAILLKLARMITGLHSAKALFEHGLFQDQAALQRMLDEFQEDILFLVYAETDGELTSLHRAYLQEFYREEFEEEEEAINATQKRGLIPRQKIRAYLAKMGHEALDPSSSAEVSRTISKAYSGYIHGAAPHILDMYGGNPPAFHVRGMLGTGKEAEHVQDLWNYFYRGTLSFGYASKAFGDQAAFDKVVEFETWFEKQSGTNYGENAKKPYK